MVSWIFRASVDVVGSTVYVICGVVEAIFYLSQSNKVERFIWGCPDIKFVKKLHDRIFGPQILHTKSMTVSPFFKTTEVHQNHRFGFYLVKFELNL